jgi:U4/U6.U5 tri-snRNP-associated protein 1
LDTGVGFSQAKNGMQSVVSVALPSQRLQSRISGLQSVAESREVIEKKHQEEDKIREEIKNKEITEEDMKNAEVLEEPIVGKGVARVLEILRMRKMLGQAATFVGRNKDNKTKMDFEQEIADEDDTKINRTDQYGNQITRKQAFRELCYRFHGHKPSQKQREKLQNRLLKAQKSSNLVSGQESFFAKALQKEQKRKKTAFMVIDTKPKSKIDL